MTLNSCAEWMKFLLSDERVFSCKPFVIRVYGEEDCSYLVVENQVADNPKVIDQYTVHSLPENNALFSLLCFLDECEFNVDVLVRKIVDSPYVEDGVNEVCRFKFVEVARYQLQEE